MSKSRSQIIAKNASFSSICHIGNLLVAFVVRTIFIQHFSIEYLGVNGLFTNILTILSFAELGIGNAIIFSLYKPLAQNDTYRVTQLIALYRNAYRYIALTIVFLGLIFVPFVNRLVLERPNINEDLRVIYLLFLANIVISYLYVYKQTLIIAEQKKYIVSIYTLGVTITLSIFQCVAIILFHSFYIYLLIVLLTSFINNFVIARKCDSLYPYLKKKVDPLPKEERNKIFSNVKSLSMYRFGGVILSGTSNIIASKMFGIAVVGLCSNYFYIVAAVSGILSQVLSSFTASIGNLNAVESKENKEIAFNKTCFFCFWLFGFITTGMYVYFDDFIKLWIGEKFLINPLIVFSILLLLYVDNVAFPVYTYRTTLGLFRQGRMAPLIAAGISILLAIFLGKVIGVAGVFLAVPLARLCSLNIIDIHLVYKYGLFSSPIGYYRKYLVYSFFAVLACLISWHITSFIVLRSSLLEFVLRVICYAFIYNLLFISAFGRTSEYKLIKSSLLALLKK